MITCRKSLRISRTEVNNFNTCLYGYIKTRAVNFTNGVRFIVDFISSLNGVVVSVTVLEKERVVNLIQDSLAVIKTFSYISPKGDFKYVLDIKDIKSPFILVLEGSEASGKSTVAKALHKKLTEEGKNVICTREPGGVPTSEKIRDIIMGEAEDGTIIEPETEAYLFAAARSEHVSKKIVPAINNGTSIIMDRYFYSSLAYQGVARGLGFEKTYEINNLVIDKAYPDLTIYLDINEKVRAERLKIRGIENRLDKESETFMKYVEEGYNYCRMFPEFVKINGNGSVDEVVDLCIEEMKKNSLI